MGFKTVVVKTELLQSEAEKEYQRKLALYDEGVKNTKGIFKSKPARPKKPSPASLLGSVVDQVVLQAKLDKAISELCAEGYTIVNLTPVQSSSLYVDPIKSNFDAIGDAFDISGGGSMVVPYTAAIIILASKA